MWPGFGENLRVLRWIIERCGGNGRALETPIGLLPSPGDLDVDGLDLPPASLERLLAIDRRGWIDALRSQDEFFARFEARLPEEMRQEHDSLERRLKGAHSQVGPR